MEVLEFNMNQEFCLKASGKKEMYCMRGYNRLCKM